MEIQSPPTTNEVCELFWEFSQKAYEGFAVFYARHIEWMNVTLDMNTEGLVETAEAVRLLAQNLFDDRFMIGEVVQDGNEVRFSIRWGSYN